MITRLNDRIKMSNMLINRFSNYGSFSIPFRKFRMVRAYSVFFGICQFSHFDHLFANCLFGYKKGKNSLQNRIKLKIRNSPQHLVFTIWNMGLVQKMKLTSKSRRNPIKKWKFCIVALNLRPVRKILATLLNSFTYIKTTFCINISSKICKIFFCGRNCISNFGNFIFYGIRNNIKFFFKKFHFFNKRSFKFFSARGSKFLKKRTFFFFFHKKFRNFFERIKSFSRKPKMERWMPIAGFGNYRTNSSVKMFHEPYNRRFSNGNNHKMASPLLVSYLKTTVPINISCSICKISVLHASYNSLLAHLSHQVTDVTNNAYKFVSGIEGENKFGTAPVRSAYFMISSTQLQSDFDALTGSGFIAQYNYPNNSSALFCEYGSVFNVRILTTSEAPVMPQASANNQAVYYNTVLGKQAVTHINQDGCSMSLIYRDPYYSGMLAQNATLAIKFWQAQAITQDTAIRNLLCTRATSYGGV